MNDNDRVAEDLSLKKAWTFFFPLTLSWLMMFASQPIVQAGLARLPSAELTLAAFAVAFHAAVLLESPIFMAMPTANALVCDGVALRRTRRWVIGVSLVLSANAILVAFCGPVYDFVFRTILGNPIEVARAAQPGLKVLAVWPSIVALRLYHQGILIRFGRTRFVTLGTIARLVVMLITLPIAVRLFPSHGVVVGAGTLLLGVVVDGLVTVLATRRLLLTGVLEPETEAVAHPASRHFGAFCAFFLPLASTSCLRTLSQPLMLGGIARSHQATLALAAWPVGLGTMWLFSGHIMMLQQVVLSLIKDNKSMILVRRFCGIVIGGFSLLLAIIAFSPLLGLYHGVVIGLTGEMLAMANASLRFLVFMPMLLAAQACAQGVLIRGGRTGPVNLASACNLVVAVTLLYTLAIRTNISGNLLASILMSVGLLVEVAVLSRWAIPLAIRMWGRVRDSAASEPAD